MGGEKMGDIYGIVRKENNQIIYIGQTIRSYKRRWQQHKQQAREGRPYALYNALRKYGSDNFYPVLIEQCNDDELNEREQYWITYYHTMINENGYNLTRGGDTNSARVKKEVHQYSLNGDYIQSFDSIADAGAALQISSTEISKAANEKIKISHGFIWSFEKHEKVEPYISRQREVKQYNKNGEYIQTFKNLRQAALSLNKPTGSSNIKRAIRDDICAYGFKWSY